MSVSGVFSAVSRKATVAAGTWQASILATSIVVAWIIGGFFVGFDDQLYQLFINTFTTITTFVMVFLIQGATNRDGKAVQLKLDEIIRAIEKADNRLIDIEQETDEHIEEARQDICSRKDSQ